MNQLQGRDFYEKPGKIESQYHESFFRNILALGIYELSNTRQYRYNGIKNCLKILNFITFILYARVSKLIK